MPTGDSANSLRSTFSLPHSPPLLLAAHFDKVPPVLTLTYDRLLRTGTVGVGNLLCRNTNNRYHQSAPAAVSGTTVTAPMVLVFPQVGLNTADYLATPPDIYSVRGGAALPFLDFPLT